MSLKLNDQKQLIYNSLEVGNAFEMKKIHDLDVEQANLMHNMDGHPKTA